MSQTVLESRNPARPDEVVFRGEIDGAAVGRAVAAARRALPHWSALSLDQRRPFLEKWREAALARGEELARLITREMGKTLAESRLEAKSVAEKVSITLEDGVLARTRDFALDLGPGKTGRCVFRPHGVMAVIGPFNFPAHLPNGHIIPALAMGNSVVFKPSEKTPAVGALLAAIARDAGLPDGVFSVVQGGGATAAQLVSHDGIDGVLFTGSWPVGRSITQANLERPGRMLALEMGGMSAAIICEDAHLKQAVLECVRSAFATTGQRCTCTRRVIVHRSVAPRVIRAIGTMASTLLAGDGDSTDPVFMGPLVSEEARERVLRTQAALAKAGAQILVPAMKLDRPGFFLTAGVVQVERFQSGPQEEAEVFGPLLQVAVADDDDDALEQANATQFGLAASVFTSSEAKFRRMAQCLRAGCVNWNTGTAGASSRLPFGGVGRSGNHRPAAAFAADYCAYPVAQMEVQDDSAAVPPGAKFDDRWLG